MFFPNGGAPLPLEDVDRLFQSFQHNGASADGLGFGRFVASEIARPMMEY